MTHSLELPKQSLKPLARSSITNEAVMKRALNFEAEDERSLPSSDNNNLVTMEDRLLDLMHLMVVNLPFLVLD